MNGHRNPCGGIPALAECTPRERVRFGARSDEASEHVYLRTACSLTYYVRAFAGMGIVKWSRDAREDLRQIPDTFVWAEILDLAERELRSPDTAPGFEGRAAGDPNIFYRRAISRADLDDFLAWDLDDRDEDGNQSCDYILVYRYLTLNEVIKFKLALGRGRIPPFVVLRVLHNREFARRFQVAGQLSSSGFSPPGVNPQRRPGWWRRSR